VSTIAEIKAAIEQLPLEEKEEIKRFLRELAARDQRESPGFVHLPQAPSGAKSL
jgi:hypothetical protein